MNQLAADLQKTWGGLLRNMAARLNKEGIPTARGAAWTATAVRRIQARMAAAGV